MYFGLQGEAVNEVQKLKERYNIKTGVRLNSIIFRQILCGKQLEFVCEIY